MGVVPGGNCPRWELSRWELSWVGVVLGGNCPRWELSRWEMSWLLSMGGNCPGGKCPGGKSLGGNCLGGKSPGGNCPRWELSLNLFICPDLGTVLCLLILISDFEKSANLLLLIIDIFF